MRIIVPIATRGRPMRLAGALHSLTTLASGRHQIDYVVRVDEDDERTRAIITDLEKAFGVEAIIQPRPITLGQSWNECVAGREWDACSVIADKHLCEAKNWDGCVDEVLGQRDIPASSWHLLPKPEETLLIISRKFYRAMGEQIFPEWFPFWFAERWVYEIHQLALGTGIPKVANLAMSEPLGVTQGLRDLEFWFDFFARTRPVRLRAAHKMAIALGKAIINPLPIIAEMEKGDAWQTTRIPLYYQMRGLPPGEPTPQYTIAKKRAEAYLNEVARAA